MLPLLLLAAAAPALSPVASSGAQAAVDGAVAAERAFALDAQDGGQWPAFQASAAPDAIMVGPQATPVAEALKGAPEPAVPVMWWPGTVFPACDGALAIDTGPWVRAGAGTVGTFTTVWVKQADGRWKWRLDHGRDTPSLVAAGRAPTVHAPDCAGADAATAAVRAKAFAGAGARPADDMVMQRDGQMPVTGATPLPAATFGDRLGFGHDSLWTLAWESRATTAGGHDLRVWQWRGASLGWRLALYELAEPAAS